MIDPPINGNDVFDAAAAILTPTETITPKYCSIPVAVCTV